MNLYKYLGQDHKYEAGHLAVEIDMQRAFFVQLKIKFTGRENKPGEETLKQLEKSSAA